MRRVIGLRPHRDTLGQVGVTRVLVVDDEPQIVRALTINLRARGYEVHAAATGITALAAAAKHLPDVVLLDLGLPDRDGVEVIEGLRGWTAVPIIVLSGRTGGSEKVEALDAGADDYVTKPFAMEELMARIRAVARRSPQDEREPRPTVRIGNQIVDLAAHRIVDAAGAEVRLTKTEWQLLERLLLRPGELVTQRQLLTEVWGDGYGHESGYLRFHFGQLRRKLEIDPARPKHLITEPGIGYRFTE
jgi:two-component system KDP operon response regulator KdpE